MASVLRVLCALLPAVGAVDVVMTCSDDHAINPYCMETKWDFPGLAGSWHVGSPLMDFMRDFIIIIFGRLSVTMAIF